MTATTLGASDVRRVGELYARYKSLALAAGATLLLGEPAGELREEADRLLRDCRDAASDGDAPSPQLTACLAAAEELDALLATAGEAGEPPPAAIDAVRSSHRRLRQEVWKVIPCEYVPCGASHRPPARAIGVIDG